MVSISSSIYFMRLDTLPPAAKYETHIWADYIELLCLANGDGEFSKADALERFRVRLRDLGEGGDDLSHEDDLLPGEENDKLVQLISDRYRHLYYRREVFVDFYPFSFSDDKNVLIRKDPLTLKHKFYIYLLLASNLHNVEKPIESPLTSDFEFLSKEAMKKLLPVDAKVHIFRNNALHQGKYTGNLWNKINTLAKDLRERVLASESEFSAQNTGDKGLDVVGWFPFPDADAAPGLPIYFGQCGCTASWVEKQDSCSHGAWSQIMTFCSPPGKIAFIPFCFRNSDGGWHKLVDIHWAILIDRLRLIHLLQDRLQHFEPLRSCDIVEEIIHQPEPLF